ncbi:hypothetical protein B0H67DRAFT_601141 [Lasiosphaeris hirsuta]|uniref:Uncharacterized protein n=1 Tax=Lasiosphaeris hirsuta TaxID=260670 RepID=A0AA40AH21_9PEZI|nr:hypothetical protein B0H67DRAFT_601141 [Lasiosphaeris hirsuta]
MDSKKSMFASLMEDDSDGYGAMSASPPSPFREGRSVESGEGGSTILGLGPNLSQVSQQMSCVTRETSQEDCARHRFIVWAAVKRNASKRMRPEEKLECPLLRCTQRFPDHEAMLRHLAACTYLALGEYWCYDHMRVERFDDLKCKRCLGHPSKRKKMLSLAKNFFHSLGHKSKKGHGFGLDGEDSFMPPPPYDSLGLVPLNGNTVTELSSYENEIVEIDSREVSTSNTSHSTTSMTVSDGAIDPQALFAPMPSLPELDSTMATDEQFMQWQPTPIITSPSFPITFPDDCESRSPSSKPSLQVNTHGLPGRRHAPRPAPRPVPVPSRSKGLSPSSSVRSTASTDTNGSTNSTSSNVSSLFSPSSNWSGAWSTSGINTSLTSPVDGFLPDPFADAGYEEACPGFLHDNFCELPADFPVPKVPEIMPCDPLLVFNAPQPVDGLIYDPNIALAEDSTTLFNIDEPEVEESNVCCSETKSVVGSAWDALQEHIVSSMLKTQNLGSNPLAAQLRSMSTKTIATSGLRTLRVLLDGKQPSSAIDTLCFVHVVYAFSLVVHEQGASTRSTDFFLQSLSYAHSLPPNDRSLYTRLVFEIWQPADISQSEIAGYFAIGPVKTPSRSSSLKGKSPENRCARFGDREVDALLVAALDFLDDLEVSLILGQIPSSPEVQTSGLYTKHLSDMSPPVSVNHAFAATVNYVLSTLAQDYGDASLLKNKLDGVLTRVNHGTISSVRRIEIELLFAGKECMTAIRFFGNYRQDVRRLCDQIYHQHDAAGTSRRTVYHKLGISLIESIIPELDRSTGDLVGPPFEEHDDLDIFFANFDRDAIMPLASHDLAACQDIGLGEASAEFQMPIITATPAETQSSSLSSSSSASPVTMEQQQQDVAQRELSEQQQAAKIEADSSCEICGYRPKGDPQWFKGSMAKHKKLQHSSEPPKIFKCPFPGCSSQYRNRPDNLRQHQIEKNHFVKSEEEPLRRPSKRKKVATEE